LLESFLAPILQRLTSRLLDPAGYERWFGLEPDLNDLLITYPNAISILWELGLILWAYPKTRLYLMSPPKLDMPSRPLKEDAQAALKLLDGLLTEFPFVDEESRSVALSGFLALAAVLLWLF
jgi:hypothetical protein